MIAIEHSPTVSIVDIVFTDAVVAIVVRTDLNALSVHLTEQFIIYCSHDEHGYYRYCVVVVM